MRRTLFSFMPAATAMVRVLQCVAAGGFSRVVLSHNFLHFGWRNDSGAARARSIF